MVKYSDDILDLSIVLTKINTKISKKIERDSKINQLEILNFFSEELNFALKKEKNAEIHKYIDPTDIMYILNVVMWMCYTAKDHFTDIKGLGSKSVLSIIESAKRKFEQISKIFPAQTTNKHNKWHGYRKRTTTTPEVIDVKEIFLQEFGKEEDEYYE